MLQACYNARNTFPPRVQDTLAYQHELCIKKGRAFNANIKCFTGFKTSNKEQTEESNRDNKYLEKNVVYKISFEETKHESYTHIILLLFPVKLPVNSYKDTKISKHLAYLERKN